MIKFFAFIQLWILTFISSLMALQESKEANQSIETGFVSGRNQNKIEYFFLSQLETGLFQWFFFYTACKWKKGVLAESN